MLLGCVLTIGNPDHLNIIGKISSVTKMVIQTQCS